MNEKPVTMDVVGNSTVDKVGKKTTGYEKYRYTVALVCIVDAAKTMVFGGFLEIFGKTIGQINFKLDVYQGSRVLKTIVSIEIDFS